MTWGSAAKRRIRERIRAEPGRSLESVTHPEMFR